MPVFHRAVFRALVEDAVRGTSCLRYRGRYWTPVQVGRGGAIYRQAPDLLACVQERVEDYEFWFYRSLLRSQYGRDGILRPRTRLWRERDGAYRASVGASGENS